MRKMIIAMLFIFIITLLLTSCSLPHTFNRLLDNDEKVANKRFEQILDAIENSDENALKKLFSQKSIAVDNDLEESIFELFDFYQGELVYYNNWSGPIVEEGKNDDGTSRSYKFMESTYDVETSKQKYCFAIKEYVSDTADPDNVGIYSLYVILAENTNIQFAYWGDGKWTSGIVIDQKEE